MGTIELIPSIAATKHTFTPTDIAGLMGWWDFSDPTQMFTDTGLTTPVTADGDAIAGVTDKSGQANHLTQGTAGNRPLYKVNRINGWPTALFDNTNDFLSRTTYTGGAISQPDTLFLVVKVATTASFQEPMDGITARQILYDADGTHWGMYAGSTWTSSIAYSTGTTMVAVGVFNGASSHLYRDGGAGEVMQPGSGTINGIRFGMGGDAVPLNGEVGQGLIYTGALTAAQINSVGSYLATKYGTTWTAV